MLKKSCAILMSAVLAVSSYAVAAKSLDNTPDKCPSVASIQGEGLDVSYIKSLDKYIGKKSSYYDTNAKWNFAMGYFQASSEGDAMTQVNNALMQLSGNPTPRKEGDFTWVCSYQALSNGIAIAIFSNDDSNVINRFLR